MSETEAIVLFISMCVAATALSVWLVYTNDNDRDGDL